ncbi:MAG: flagellar export protein FliJ [Firmicutes bacterium]|nr:flagellar export protein FliJ [Bacillota bacterium]
MKKFKFKLETVLKVKSRVEELRQKELKEAEVRREQARRQLAQRQEEMAATVANYREQFQANIDLYKANDYHRFIKWLSKQIELATQHLEQCEQEVHRRRLKLMEATREKKVLEKLKEKAYEEYKAEELREEIKFLDELGTSQFFRQKD